MLLAYCQFLLSLATLISHLCISSPISSVAAVGANPSVRQTARYDPDNESLGPPYGLHVIGNGNRDDGLTTSGRHNHGCYGATPPTQIPQSQCAAEVLLTAEDMYQSNSIWGYASCHGDCCLDNSNISNSGISNVVQWLVDVVFSDHGVIAFGSFSWLFFLLNVHFLWYVVDFSTNNFNVFET